MLPTWYSRKTAARRVVFRVKEPGSKKPTRSSCSICPTLSSKDMLASKLWTLMERWAGVGATTAALAARRRKRKGKGDEGLLLLRLAGDGGTGGDGQVMTMPCYMVYVGGVGGCRGIIVCLGCGLYGFVSLFEHAIACLGLKLAMTFGRFGFLCPSQRRPQGRYQCPFFNLMIQSDFLPTNLSIYGQLLRGLGDLTSCLSCLVLFL